MSKREQLYLKQNLQVEALLNQWYAVSFVIPPASAAMFTANLYVKVMKSYLLSPDMHASAASEPTLMGGRFINYQKNRVAEIKELLDKTLRNQAKMIEFAEAVKFLDKLLKTEARGFSLEPLYQKIPAILKNYVEIVYDLNNNPSIRFIEGLLYKSPFYDPTLQSLGFSLVEKDIRPFVLSTPRLQSSDYLIFEIPFNDEKVDELFRLRETPRCFGEIKELLELDDNSANLFSNFLTAEVTPSKNKSYEGEGIRIRYFGHACLLIQFNNLSILSDPLISYKYPTDILRYTYADLPEVIDYVLITHNHLDHIVLESLLQLRHKIKSIVVPKTNSGTLADPSLKLLLKNIGFANVIEIDEFECLEIIGGSITGLPFIGEHHDLNIRARITYLLRLMEKTIYVAADSCNLEPMLFESIKNLFGEVDILFLGMECDGAPLTWYYGALLTDTLNREMDYSRSGSASNYERAVDMIMKLCCKQVFIYAMGLEPWLSYILSIDSEVKDSVRINESNRLVSDCRDKGLIAERLFARKEIFI